MERFLNRLTHYAVAMLAGLCLAFALPAAADPPSRAIRISLVSGGASFSPAGSDRWVQARINRPIWIGDRVWSGDGRVELQLGGASLRLAPRTSIQVLNFDDRLTQIEMTQGSIALRVRTIDSNDAIEINTPSFAFVTQQEGDYRIDVERDRTAVAARRGYGDVYGAEVAYRIDRRERFVFYGSDLRDYDVVALGAPDPFDRWARERAMREDRSVSARYVSPELVGYVDLDSHGDWRVDATFGNVWVPRVSADWAPYRYGHWSWIDPWGWTWVDDAPWGWAPSHYGRWTQLGSSWAWVPGPRNVAPVYAPALVGWFGGDSLSLSISSGRTRGIGWFPLAPGEVWRPTYDVSREYFTRVNMSNTVVNNTTIVNVYNQRNDARIANVDYRFRAAPNAVTAVPLETFVRSQPVQQQNVRVNSNVFVQAPVVAVPPAQPVVQSFIGPASAAQAKPPAETLQRPVIARTAPAAASPTLENRAALVKDRGQPAPQGAPAPGATASPGSPQPAGPAPQATAAPGQVRANVKVVDDKVKPAAAPQASSEGRRGRGDEPPGRAAPEKAPPAASTPQPAPQAAQPGREPTAQPPQAAPRRETPREGREPPGRAQPTPVQPAQPAPPVRAEPERQPAATPPKPEPPSRVGPALPQERTDRGRGDGVPTAPGRGPAVTPPAAGAPPAAQQAPESRPQLREATPAPVPQTQRGPDQARERAAPAAPESRAVPAAPVAPPPSRPQADDSRKGGPPPAKPAAAPEPAKPAPPAPVARPEQRATPPAAAPAPASPPAKGPPAEARRDGDKGKDDRRKDKDKEKDEEKRSN